MRTLFLLRHSLTAANEARLYCGRTDLPLSSAGRALADELRDSRPLPHADAYFSSGSARADETLALLTSHAPDALFPDLREMDFGAFEMRGYAELRTDADYIRWIEDETGDVACPGGECRNAFEARVRRGGEALLASSAGTALCVCHGGAIEALMRAWFPQVQRHFYEWQPAACRGYRIDIDGAPSRFEEI